MKCDHCGNPVTGLHIVDGCPAESRRAGRMNRDETIEQAAKVMHAEVCCPCDPQGCDWTHTGEARYAHALADAGLLARPLPTREQIAMAIYEVLNFQYGDFCVPDDAADAVLALLKGQEA